MNQEMNLQESCTVEDFKYANAEQPKYVNEDLLNQAQTSAINTSGGEIGLKKEEKLFGTHIREAKEILREWINS